MPRGAAAILVSVLLSTPAVAEKKAAEKPAEEAGEKPRLLVLPLPPSKAVRGDETRLFDARLLVALDEIGRVRTVTATEEPECADADCLAALGVAAGAAQVLSMTLLAESEKLTLFATLIESATGVSVKRTELTGLDAATLSKSAAADVARWAAGTSATLTLGLEMPSNTTGRLAAAAVVDRLSALGTIPVVMLDDKANHATLTHRAEIKVVNALIVKQIHHVHHYFDGVFLATLSITDLASSKVVFSRTVKITASRRSRYSTRAEVTALLVVGAVDEWMTAFRFEKVESQLIASQPTGRNP